MHMLRTTKAEREKTKLRFTYTLQLDNFILAWSQRKWVTLLRDQTLAAKDKETERKFYVAILDRKAGKWVYGETKTVCTV